jgi:hypothetical protein
MKIIFQPMYPYAEHTVKISAAAQHLPGWYKSMPLKMEGTKTELHEFESNSTNSTLKGCFPFLDALTSGYMVTTAADIELTKDDTFIKFRWRTPDNLVMAHNPAQTPNIPVNEMASGVYKWISSYKIKTPEGYSCLFTHPLNRNDLPFKTFSGIVDTDNYTLPTEFPFQVLDSVSQIIIPAGTPIAQIFPFKRINWNSEYKEYNENETKEAEFSLLHKIVKSYKNQWWNKKTYQ